MKHHIIVKFNETAPELKKMLPRIDQIFSGVLKVPGISGYKLVKNCIARPNRYDLMIIIEMAENALPAYDDCEAHHAWKNEFSSLIEKKAIFDCE